jgi:hypothetical protein
LNKCKPVLAYKSPLQYHESIGLLLKIFFPEWPGQCYYRTSENVLHPINPSPITFANMKLIRNHAWWWLILIIASTVVSIITSNEITPAGLAGSILGHLLFSIIVAFIPWIVYKLMGQPLTTEQMMATITIGWTVLAIANLSV